MNLPISTIFYKYILHKAVLWNTNEINLFHIKIISLCYETSVNYLYRTVNLLLSTSD